MNRLKSVLEQRSKDWDPRVRRRLFSWRMFLIILLVVSVLSIGNVLMLEKLLKMEVFCICTAATRSISRCARSAAPCVGSLTAIFPFA